MGQPVVHFEVVGKDEKKLQSFFTDLFGWKFESAGDASPTNYGIVSRDDNLNSEGVGINGGVGSAPEDYDGHVTFYVEVPDVGAALDKAEELGGTKTMGPSKMGGIEIGLFTDPEGHVIGVVNPN